MIKTGDMIRLWKDESQQAHEDLVVEEFGFALDDSSGRYEAVVKLSGHIHKVSAVEKRLNIGL